MLLCRERPGDVAAIAAVHRLAFARTEISSSDPPEVALVSNLRGSEAWIPALSIVAEVDSEVVGHVVCSRAMIADRFPVLGLGPLGVFPDCQGIGVGSALMYAVIAASDALDEPLIALLGNVAFYRRFGFAPASEYDIEAPRDWYGDQFQVRLLTNATGAERGVFQYARSFDALPQIAP
jgi:putative acetyltransferase